MAHSGYHNCTNKNGHAFVYIDDAKKKKEIRKQRPKLKLALWECMHCEKIMESM